jgi:mRNA interferase MazF
MVRGFVPSRGDVVWLEFDPQSGREQRGKRPALALSPATYNGPVGLAVVAPVTSKRKGYGFEVLIPDGVGVAGVVLPDQICNIDWRSRKAKLMAQMPAEVVEDVLAKVVTLTDPQED